MGDVVFDWADGNLNAPRKMDAEETGYGTRAVGRGVDTDAVLFRIVESGGVCIKSTGGVWHMGA